MYYIEEVIYRLNTPRSVREIVGLIYLSMTLTYSFTSLW
jgi:hypothetical protein